MSNIILIGMPGAGKSTLGVQLAKDSARDFVDTDVLIQLREHKTLQQIIDGSDYLHLRAIEEAVLLALHCDNHVIATGGSAVYSNAGMAHLSQLGQVVFLHTDLAELRKRINNYQTRGITRRPDQSFESLFQERQLLYQQFANITINCNGCSQQSILAQLQLQLYV
ncbi:MAG: shikimate kinase [Paraglaciecola psychrophila]|jgi:shikimate kinase